MESTRNPFLISHQYASAAAVNDSRAPQGFLDWNSYHPAATGGGGDGERGTHALPASPCLYSGGSGDSGGPGGSHNPDPHLMCLKLGKRHYFGDGGERGKKPYYEAGGGSGLTAAAPAATGALARCQVDGCQAALVNAKEYHRRHKVCEMQSKAPRAVVLGLEQRFCQQCSRFHAVGEFDETKRSCRRRLAGHNERRRKNSHDLSIPRNQPHLVNRNLMTYGGSHSEFAQNNNGCALSLLSSKNDSSSWVSSPDLPSMCSAALWELIAENRAAILARQLNLPHHHHLQLQPQNAPVLGSQYQQQMGTTGSHLTLDLMQAPTSAFGLLSVRGRPKEDDEECPDLWGNSFRGSHV